MGKRIITFLCCLVFVFLLVFVSADDPVDKEKVNDSLSSSSVSSIGNQSILLPESLQLPARILFGISEGSSVSLLHLSLVLVLFIFFLLFFLEFVEMTSFSRVVSFMISFGLTLLLGVMGLFNSLAQALMDFFGSLGVLGFFLLIIGVLIVLFILKKVVKKLQHKRRLARARARGQRLTEQRESINTFADTVKKVDEEIAE